MKEYKMKKLIGTIIAFTLILTGCSNNTATTATPNVPSTSSPTLNTQNISATQGLLDNIDTSQSQFQQGYYNYQGTIKDNIKIVMSFYTSEGNIVGSYFYDSQRKEIKIEGKAGENDIVLYEYDETGKNVAIFKGTMESVDKIEGTWTSANGNTSYPFTLSLASILPGTEYGKRYNIALSTKNDQDVETFVSNVQSYIKNDNKQQLSELISYPINVKINGKVKKIENKEAFVENYSSIVNSDFKKAMVNTYTKYLFANSKGIMFGEGSYNVWINEIKASDNNSQLLITAINN